MQKTGKTIMSLFVVFFAYLFGFYAGESSVPSEYKVTGVANVRPTDKDVDFSIFWDAWRAIEEKHVGRKDIDRQKMVYGAVEGMVGALEDPYTAFFQPDQAKLLQGDISGEFSGIGAEIGFKKGVLTVIAPLKNSPAEKSGLLTGDTIAKIDDTFTDNMTLEEAVTSIRGEKGSTVTLLVYRNGFDTEREIKIVRDVIQVPLLDWTQKGDGIVHLELFNFIGDIDAEFQRAAREILASGAKKIIFDLRGNPGGFLDSAITVSSYFMNRGDIVAQEDFGNGERNEFRSKGYPYFQKLPIVVLIDGGSASASEIVAGALKDTRNTTLVGEKTFGKGSVQEVADLQHETLLKITVAKWLTPSGRSIQDQGIEPDIKVEMTAEDREEKRDPQLEKALEVIKNL